VYRHGGEGGPVFVAVPAPTDEDVQALRRKINGRILKLLTRRGALVEQQVSIYTADDDGDSETAAPDCPHRGALRIGWARLLKRVFEIDLEHRPNCGSDLKIIAAILDAPVIVRIVRGPEGAPRSRPPPTAAAGRHA
jgi:hypothetical protein